MTQSTNKWQLKHSIVLLRLFIGWHFLYEGVIKLYNPDWTSFGYLATAQGPFESIFLFMAKEPFIGWADTLNWMALMFVGITLILGFYEKLGALVGVLLLALYYFSHPAFPWLQQLNVEGSYWFINKNLIELAACLVIYQYPTGHVFGLKYLVNRKEQPKTETV
ncbi:DoxX family membrane protein [Eudoraea sp.]|uniref:DoxX family membrane protein n=1 Tax=Eudoraea sp. TaxID=1979955 RepID=UPI003C706E3B